MITGRAPVLYAHFEVLVLNSTRVTGVGATKPDSKGRYAEINTVRKNKNKKSQIKLSLVK